MSEARRFRLFSILHREQLHAALFVIFFVAGAVAGSLVGMRSPWEAAAGVLDKLALDGRGLSSYLWGLWTMAWPSLVAVFFATSVVGFLLLPGLFFLRGYMAAASAAALWAGAGVSWLGVTACVGLPAALSIGALYLLCDDAFSASLLLFRTCSGGPRLHFDFVSSRRILIAAILLAAASGAQQLFIPLLFHNI